MLEGRNPRVTPADYIRTWERTVECDDVVDMRLAREDYRMLIYFEHLEAIVNSREGGLARMDAWRAMRWAAHGHHAVLLKAVSWPDYLATRPSAWWLCLWHYKRFPGVEMARRTL